jgi:hypothetical protein
MLEASEIDALRERFQKGLISARELALNLRILIHRNEHPPTRDRLLGALVGTEKMARTKHRPTTKLHVFTVGSSKIWFAVKSVPPRPKQDKEPKYAAGHIDVSARTPMLVSSGRLR